MLHAHPSHLLYFINLLGEEHKCEAPHYISFLHSVITQSLLGADIPLSTSFLNAFILV